jgi:DNA modification methylase
VTEFLDGKVVLHPGDCRDVLKGLVDASIDSVVTDPPYALVSITKRFGADGAAPARAGVYARGAAGFMGKQWDNGDAAFAATFWTEVLRVLKPGGHVLAFGGTRTYHRLACAIEDAGFEIRDQIGWAYGSGFPKSHNVGKGMAKRRVEDHADWKAVGVWLRSEREQKGFRQKDVAVLWPSASGGLTGWLEAEIVGEITVDSPGFGDEHRFTGDRSIRALEGDAAKWNGWGTALKPAWEPIVMARKPLIGTVAENVLKHGTGAINIDGCWVDAEENRPWRQPDGLGVALSGSTDGSLRNVIEDRSGRGRWPANIIHDGSEDVIAAFPEQQSGGTPASRSADKFRNTFGEFKGAPVENGIGSSEGNAARFFYTAKADADDRLGSKHPTVKPLDLMQYLVRLVTPPGGVVLDPFAGTGSTGEAAWREGMRAVLIEREPEYQADIARRMELAENPTKRAAVAATKNKLQGAEGTPLFEGIL